MAMQLPFQSANVLCDLIRPIPSGAKLIVHSNKIDPQKFQAAINTVGFVI